MRNQRQELLDFALQLVNLAGAQIMFHYGNCIIDTKSDGTEVTDADRRAEEVIREMILKYFPDDNILGEEFGDTNIAGAKRQWIIDPMDGTTWFTLGIPIFGTLVALLENNEPVIGVIHFPALGETVYASKGFGCWFKSTGSKPVRVQVDSNVSLGEAVVSAAGIHSSNIYLSDGEIPYDLISVIRAAKKFRFCGDCLQHALVCRGRIHVAIDTIMKPWDSAALIPCIEEAGGIVTTLSGQRDDAIFGGNLIASCDRILHNKVLKLIQPQNYSKSSNI